MVDYIIVGAGAAGCVIAARLSEDADVSVLLVEAGPPDRHPYIHMPVGFSKMTAGPLTWGLKTAPQKHAMNREIPYAQARVLGGGGSINAQVFTRGAPSDYDGWANEHGCHGWGFAEIQRYFLKMEDNDTLAGDWHGVGGPLGVSSVPPHRLTRAFVQACQEFGIPYNPDFNGPRQAGTGAYQTTTRGGRRCSTAVGYLRAAVERPNLALRTGVEVLRVVVEHGRAVGIEIGANGRGEMLRAEREVIVTAGAVGSPKLLLLSGIGPVDELREAGVAAVHDLPGVGRNLQDHYGIDLVYELGGDHSYDKYKRLPWMAWAGLEYALFRKGPVASNIVEGGAFWHSGRDGDAPPDLQFHFLVGAGVEAGVPEIAGAGVTINSYTLRPKARGTIRLASGDVRAQPVIDPNFLGDPDDLRVSVEGVRISREVMHQSALGRYVRQEHFPGSGVRTQADFEAYAREYGRTSYHPVGACRMGVGADAVVDPTLRVHGIEGLRVCDSSIMPSLVGSNTNAATIMIGEKASDLIRGNRIGGAAV